MNSTPRPWTITKEKFRTFDNEVHSNISIHTMIGEERIALLGQNKEANAELIVRAVNAHDELVEALKKILDPETMIEEKIIFAKQALAKAEGRS